MEVAADSATAWQIPPFVVLSNIVKHLKDVRDRAAMSSVCRFWRSHTFYWTDVYELVLNHANLDNDYFKFALNGSDYVQTISNKRLSVNGELPLCLRCFFERLTALNKVTLVACDVRTPLIRSLKYFSRKLHLLIITDDYENTTFDPLPDPLALYNKAVPECLQYVQANWDVLPTSCIITVDYMRMWLGRIRLILAILPRSVRYVRLFNPRYREMSITEKEWESERMKRILKAIPPHQRFIIDIVGDICDASECAQSLHG